MRTGWDKPAKIDREAQRVLLHAMADAYPQVLCDFPEGFDRGDKHTVVNVMYLKEHGLCETDTLGEMGMAGMEIYPPRITAKGLDFLADDGGLGAILDVVTVRFEANTIKALIANKLEESDAPEEEKGLIRKQLDALPETALKAGMTELVKVGLNHTHDVMQLLQKCFGLG
ncbi:hypothetical protein ACI01nite_25300 [Acetobacter cibinongensis]|uniref:Uncharacterized protein n=1 Tax=Acetobacter cibinongensis TaxID=146475 RepID=A0A0D6N6B9_9PROT|nr:hypothetical protein [Acetobacter cibinongensis]GAN61577.1 hypothetical protein Abci_046_010 [Acetobacter cibinongensis]GBQ17692.1 hypothetical protein AA0482_1986 [Acetobacter cibinongensis NRIC 0482]GEL59928.1 hypothetical protein ACI01nite_25300 [Acetobacter cibinongensis]